jgi:NodT family efflux transporter outer membrane factor (OMF) lipoprotein
MSSRPTGASVTSCASAEPPREGPRRPRGRGRRAAWGAVVGLLLTGCTVGPNFTRPPAPAVSGYTQEPVTLPPPGGTDIEQRFVIEAAVARQWWELFRSPQLNETIALALTGSPTLASARATLAQAEAVVAQVRGVYYPQVDLAGTANSSSTRETTDASARRPSTTTGATINVFSFGPLLTYDPDIFGHNRRFVEQEAALAENQRYQLAAAYLSLAAGAVTQAVIIASTRAQIQAAEQVIATDEHNLELVRIEFEAGAVAMTDVLLAQSQLASDRTLLPPLRQQLDVARHALSVLVGESPAEWSPPDFDLAALTLPAELPVILPSELIHQRPDILAAEAQLHAANAAVGVATALLYPNVTLSAAWTVERAVREGPGLLDTTSLITSLAGGLTAPLFHGGALEAQRRAAVAAFEAQLATYRQVLLLAFGQVADTLRALQNDAELLRAQIAALTTSEASLKLAQDAYSAGRGSLIQVLDAQRLYQQALLGYVRAKAQRYQDTVLLFQTMGGASQDWLEAAAAGPRYMGR